MLKLFGFVLGLAGGAGGTAAWLLSQPDQAGETSHASPSRTQLIRTRFDLAVTQGKRAGDETETRLRRELDAYRRDPKRPNPFA